MWVVDTAVDSLDLRRRRGSAVIRGLENVVYRWPSPRCYVACKSAFMPCTHQSTTYFEKLSLPLLESPA